MCQRYEQHVYKCLQQSATYKEKLVVAKNIRNNRRRIIPTCADILFSHCSHCSHCSCCSHEASRLSPALRHAWQTQALRNKQLGGAHLECLPTMGTSLVVTRLLGGRSNASSTRSGQWSTVAWACTCSFTNLYLHGKNASRCKRQPLLGQSVHRHPTLLREIGSPKSFWPLYLRMTDRQRNQRIHSKTDNDHNHHFLCWRDLFHL